MRAVAQLGVYSLVRSRGALAIIRQHISICWLFSISSRLVYCRMHRLYVHFVLSVSVFAITYPVSVCCGDVVNCFFIYFTLSGCFESRHVGCASILVYCCAVCLFVCLRVCASVWPSVCLPCCLSVCVSVCLSCPVLSWPCPDLSCPSYLSVSMYLSIYNIYIYVCIYTYI